jgi:hypothetical protein
MDLKISLPAGNEAPQGALEVQPNDIESWLENLPLLNTEETAHRLIRSLIALNRMTLDDRRRFKILESFRRPARAVCLELRKQYLGLPLPLDERRKQVASQVRVLYVEMAYGYKLIANSFAQAVQTGTIDKQMLATVLQRAIRYMTGILMSAYELYTSPPEGSWREIHQLYRFAEILGAIDVPVKDELNDAVPQSSPGHVYKQALLLDFSDPYHQPPGMIAKIYRYLDRWAPLAQVSLAFAALKPNCQFLINLDNDRAGGVNTETSQITTEMRYRLLNTVELARIIHQQLSSMQSGEFPDPDGLEKNFFAGQGYDMLLRLLSAWGVNPKRVFPRTPVQGKFIEVAFGIPAIHFRVNGEKAFEASTTEVGPQPKRTAVTDARPAANRVEPGATLASARPWVLIDESAGGFALTNDDEPTGHVRVGDILATRAEGGQWQIGVVRWTKMRGARSLDVGVQRLAPGAKPVAIMALDGDQDAFLLALELPEIKPLRQPASLVTPRGLFKAGRLFYLDNGYQTRQIRSLKLVELSNAFERFQFQHNDA